MRWHEKLTTRLMIPMIGVLAISISISLYWLYRQQHRAMLERASEATDLVSGVAKAGLRAQMLRRSEDLTQQTIDVISAESELVDLSILSKNGVIRYSSDHSRIGEQLHLDDPTCTPCHAPGIRAGKKTALIDSSAGHQVMRSMNLVANEPECQSCHGDHSEYRGMLVLDRSLHRDQLRIREVQRSLVGIGVTSLVLVAGLTMVIVKRLVQQPVDTLIDGTLRIRAKDFTTRIEVSSGGELGALAASFNAMVDDTRTHIREIQNKSFELETLYTIVDRVTRTMDLENLRKIILDIVYEAFSGVASAFIAIRPNQSDEICIGSREPGKEMTSNLLIDSTELDRVSPPIDGRLLKRWLDGDLEARQVSPDGARAEVPLRPGERKVGLLSVTKSPGHTFAEHELHLLEALEAHISVAVENARLYSLAITDELTRVYSLRYFQIALQEELGRYERYGQKSALLMIDVDDFKRVNDTHGHTVGDEALKYFCRILKESVREVDIICRYGGEEFAVVLPAARGRAAQIVAERIRSAIEENPYRIGERIEIPLTVSVGIATCPEDGQTVPELVEAADAALYRAKGGGKNQVVALAAG